MTPAGTTHYVYDRAGHLIAEATSAGSPVREYIWLDDMPLAVVADIDTPTPNLYFVHADHLDRPIKMTDSLRVVVWDAIFKPFGEVYLITGVAANNLRFPGQYFLIESGLHYNWHRHYDPTLGRYTQPDPLGFVDGPSVFSYANSAPSQYVDPKGQFFVPIVAGVLGGIALDYIVGKIKEAKCGCNNTPGAAVSAAMGGAAGVFGPFKSKPFSPFGSGTATSAFSEAVGAGYTNGLYGLGVRNVARAFGFYASYAAPAAFAGLILYDIYDIVTCGS